MNKRLEEIDFARVIPLLFLPLVHLAEECYEFGFFQSNIVWVKNILLYLCAFGPSIFMIILGMNIVFSHHTSPKELAKRGVFTIILFFVHNVFRALLPAILVTLSGEDMMQEGIIGMVTSDILFFAGLSFLFFAFMKKIKVPPFGMFIISLLLLSVHNVIAPYTTVSVDTPLTVFNVFLGNFFHVTPKSAFPVLAWLIFPVIGYCCGTILLKYQEEKQIKKFYDIIGYTSFAFLIALSTTMVLYGLNPIALSSTVVDNYKVDFFSVLLDVPLAFFTFFVCYYVYNWLKKKLPSKFSEMTVKISKCILIFYLIQWILVLVCAAILMVIGYQDAHIMGLGTLIFLSIAVTMISLILSFKVSKKIDNRKHLQSVKTY